MPLKLTRWSSCSSSRLSSFGRGPLEGDPLETLQGLRDDSCKLSLSNTRKVPKILAGNCFPWHGMCRQARFCQYSCRNRGIGPPRSPQPATLLCRSEVKFRFNRVVHYRNFSDRELPTPSRMASPRPPSSAASAVAASRHRDHAPRVGGEPYNGSAGVTAGAQESLTWHREP